MKNEFITIMEYKTLREIIVGFFKKIENIELRYISIEYFIKKLMGYEEKGQPCFIMDNELGETRFDIPRGDIFKILSMYLKEKNFELIEVQYNENGVAVKYKIKAERNEFSIIEDEDDAMVESEGRSR